jgi:hypothetical protein
MAQFIQICASQNDLFALDDEGVVYHHNFNTKAWVRLMIRRSDEEAPGEDLRQRQSAFRH